MALQDILVQVDHTPAAALRLSFALALARRHEARLGVLFARLIPGRWADESGVPPDQPLHELRAQFAQEADGVVVEWHEALVPGSDRVLAAEIRARARVADLLVLGQSDPAQNEEELPADLPQRLTLELGRPVIVVPYAWRFEGAPARILVGWDGGREAARAVNDALPLLKAASWVQILAVNPAEQERPAVDGTALALHLARHGVQAECAALEAHDIHAGDLLLSRAADEAADLLVTGAYGHTRITELILGGVTRQLLQEMTLPVLMSH